MKKLISVRNTGEGHLTLRFAPFNRTHVCFTSFDGSMINILGDEETEEVAEVEVLYVQEEGRIRKLLHVAELYNLDLSPLFETYEGALSEMTIAQYREKYKDAS